VGLDGQLTCVARRHPDRPIRLLTGRLHRKLPVSLAFVDDTGPIVSGTVWFDDGDTTLDAATVEPMASLAVPREAQLTFGAPAPAASDSTFEGCYVCGPGNVEGLRLRRTPIGPGAVGCGSTPCPVTPPPTATWPRSSRPLRSTALRTQPALDSVVRRRRADGAGWLRGLVAAQRANTIEVGWRLRRWRRRDGRKVSTVIGLFDGSGTAYALARHLWITISLITT
jgi:hypothetical protein